MLTKEDALGIITTYEYDDTGNVIRKIEDYTADGTTGRNVVTEYSYDPLGNRLSQRTEADGIMYERINGYDVNSELAGQTDPNGHTTRYIYDDADQLVAVTDPLNQTTSYTYTGKGLLESTTLPNGTVIKAVYNGFSQKVQEIEDDGGLNLTTSYTYDLNGNRLTMTDANTKTTTYTYDALNRLKTIEDPLTQTTSYRYDRAGNLRFLTDAKNQTTEMVYDALNRLTQEIRPMSEETEYWYDDAGNLEEKRDAKGQRTEYDYDEATNLLQEIRYFDSSDVQTRLITFTYDRVGNLETYNDGTTSAVYEYDDLNRKISETVQYPGFSKTFSYTYYANGLKQTFSMPGGTTYTYTYDNNNRLTSLTVPGQGAIEYPSYTLNRPDSITFPGGSSQSYQYDALLRLKQISAPGSGLDYQYTYDNVSNILTKITEHGNYGYGYDDVYRLTNADNPTLDDEAYAYDGVGNRETASGVTGSITHNENNELTVYGEIEYEYDANGNMIRKSIGIAAINYTYNPENRLILIEDELSGTVIAEYYYDPFGRRLWKDADGTRTYFFYADEGLVAEYDGSGNELRAYGYQPDSTWTTDPLWLKEGTEYYWYQNDPLDTPQKLVDGSGTVVWSAQYSSSGETVVDVETVTNNLRFPGQYFDAETGLHYNWFRYYDPDIGRYLRVDPIGFAGGDVNLYVYVGNNLINWVDPWGLSRNPTIIIQLYPNLVRGTRTEADIHAIVLHQTGGSTKEGVFETCK